MSLLLLLFMTLLLSMTLCIIGTVILLTNLSIRPSGKPLITNNLTLTDKERLLLHRVNVNLRGANIYMSNIELAAYTQLMGDDDPQVLHVYEKAAREQAKLLINGQQRLVSLRNTLLQHELHVAASNKPPYQALISVVQPLLQAIHLIPNQAELGTAAPAYFMPSPALGAAIHIAMTQAGRIGTPDLTNNESSWRGGWDAFGLEVNSAPRRN